MWDEWIKYLVLILGCYLFGSIPFMYLMGRLQGVDLREYDDMHIALWRHVGRLQGFAGVVFDFARGISAVLIARALGFTDGWVAFAGVAAVAGQMWTIFIKFDGEKGNSIGLAMSGTLATKVMLIALVPVFIGFSIRTVPRFFRRNQPMDERLKFGGPPSLSLPLGMAVSFAVMPLAAWWLDYPPKVIFAFVILFVLIMVRRVTARVSEDLRQPSGKRSMLINRFLFDRSKIESGSS